MPSITLELRATVWSGFGEIYLTCINSPAFAVPYAYCCNEEGLLRRVFYAGFAYVIKRGEYLPGLVGKKGVIITTAGAQKSLKT